MTNMSQSEDDKPNPDLQEKDGDDEITPSCNCCTFAVTGPSTSFQTIFICHECFNENSEEQSPLCICQACAEICHAEHDVEYIGMGPSYCDCDNVGNCPIFQKSQEEAERLGVWQQSNSFGVKSTASKIDKVKEKDGKIFLYDAFDCSALKNPEVSSLLVRHAQELVRHSKETFWLDFNSVIEDMCPLERLAWSIYQHHRENYSFLKEPKKNEGGGAEWWVQVKALSGKNTAIDLHYDKDEALAELFAIGSFPSLSTVTYLTCSSKNTEAAPTIVLDHTYSQGEEDIIETLLISRPRLGKHLVFDGTLLHGAPAHDFLKNSEAKAQTNNDNDEAPSIRVTLLVNLWGDTKPANVHPLPQKIRQELSLLPAVDLVTPLLSEKKVIPVLRLEKEDDLPEALRQRMELPFVSSVSGAIWEEKLNYKEENDGEGEEREGLVVVSFPPPPNDHDTFLLSFGAGLQAYLDYLKQQNEGGDQGSEGQRQQNENGYV